MKNLLGGSSLASEGVGGEDDCCCVAVWCSVRVSGEELRKLEQRWNR